MTKHLNNIILQTNADPHIKEGVPTKIVSAVTQNLMLLVAIVSVDSQRWLDHVCKVSL